MTTPTWDWNHYVFFNKTDGSRGWTERYYSTGGTQDSAASALQVLLQGRKTILPVEYEIAYARVDKTTGGRNSLVPTGPFPIAGTYTALTGEFLMDTDFAVLEQYTASPAAKNRKFLHGFYTQDITSGDTFTPTSTWLTNHAIFTTQLIAAFGVALRSTGGFVSPILTVTLRGATRHKVGRPFGQRAGRVRPLTSH